ncbi:MAG: HAMP domain-containing histidine kinase [Deltaproteobacteria bacterium]|jgi:signal transduction histidine kinase|nr:HAMP domain-containing histidine kinase [Deltaproteobacteria bacterium]
MPRKSPRESWRPSLRLILLLVNLVILAVPISGLYLFRIYENELIRQTESELISQAALVAAMYRAEVVALGGENYGLAHWFRPPADDQSLRLVPTLLDRSNTPIRQEHLNLSAAGWPPDPTALEAASRLAAPLSEATRTTLSTIYILDFHGVLVSAGRGQGLSLERNEEVARALEGQYHSLLRNRQVTASTSLSSASRDTPFRVFAAMPVFNGQRLAGVILLSRTPRELSKALYQERWNLTQAGALVLILLVMISLTASLLIISPVKRLAREAAKLAEEPHQPPSRQGLRDLTMVREVAELRDSVLDMAERLQRRSEYLKTYASGVSHEFKTPLTAIKGAMELLGEHGQDMDPTVFRKFGANISQDLDRLERLVARLLALAKAEALNPTGAEKCEAVALIRSLAEHGREIHPDFEIVLTPGIESLELAIDGDVLETVLINLFDNSRENGATQVMASLSVDGDEGRILVEDDGPGLTAEAAEKIFTPFFTTRQNKGGTGLGLNLARTLLSPYLGRLEYAGPPAVFVVSTPLAAPASEHKRQLT